MNSDLDDLHESNDFLNLLLDNISSAVLIADEKGRIHRFNRSFLDLFDSPQRDPTETRFGEAMRCRYREDESRPCGETTHCENCILRQTLIETLTKDVPVDRAPLTREFYREGRAETRHLELSTRGLSFKGREMVLVIIHDVTDEVTQREELERKNRQIDDDLAAAAGIQRSLLPKDHLALDSVRLAWRFRPSGQIGGDFFNFHCPDNERLGLYMLDVCGHGVSAAFMATTASQFLLSRQGIIGRGGGVRAPARVLSNLEDAFPFERFGSYMTIACATLDLTDGRFTYACAGHPPPILLESDGSVSPLTHHGPIIGLGLGPGFTEEEILLRHGDRVVLYTDGILDTRSPEGAFFGEERLVEVLTAYRSRPLQEAADEVWESVQTFGRRRRPEDDISILVLEYRVPSS